MRWHLNRILWSVASEINIHEEYSWATITCLHVLFTTSPRALPYIFIRDNYIYMYTHKFSRSLRAEVVILVLHSGYCTPAFHGAHAHRSIVRHSHWLMNDGQVGGVWSSADVGKVDGWRGNGGENLGGSERRRRWGQVRLSTRLPLCLHPTLKGTETEGRKPKWWARPKEKAVKGRNVERNGGLEYLRDANQQRHRFINHSAVGRWQVRRMRGVTGTRDEIKIGGFW